MGLISTKRYDFKNIGGKPSCPAPTSLSEPSISNISVSDITHELKLWL